jgi:GNAT superfamily N-acetyltransferase
VARSLARMRIIEVVAGDDELLCRWYAAYAASQRHQRPYAFPWQLDEIRADLRVDVRRRVYRAFAGLVDDVVVSAGQIGMRMLDNVDTATVAIDTPPDRRRQGHGTAMLDHLVGIARGSGRHRLFAEVSYPYEASADGRGEPGVEFLTRQGFAFALGDVHRVLDLPVDASVLDALATEASGHHRGYRLEAWSGPVPEERLASYVALDAMVATEAPTGALELEPQSDSVDAHREMEALLAEQGRTVHSAVALDETDRVVAYTAVGVPSLEPGRCYQWGTLVDPTHRGHRLGLAVKVANLRHLRAAVPSLRSMTTFNAEVNAHMVAINEQLGFRPVERLGEFQRRL